MHQFNKLSQLTERKENKKFQFRRFKHRIEAKILEK